MNDIVDTSAASAAPATASAEVIPAVPVAPAKPSAQDLEGSYDAATDPTSEQELIQQADAIEPKEPTAEELADEQRELHEQALLEQPTDDELADTALAVETWGDTGHTEGNEALRVLQNVGIDPSVAQDLLFDAAMARDPSMVDQKALTKAVGSKRAAKVMQGLEDYTGHLRGREKAIADAVFPVVNGRANFGKILSHAQQTLSADQFNAYEVELNKGGTAATKAAEALSKAYRHKSAPEDRKIPTTSAAVTAAATASSGTPAGISRAEMVSALDRLHNSTFPQAEVARRDREVRAARAVGKAAGK